MHSACLCWRCLPCDSHVKVRLTETETQRQTHRHTDTQTHGHTDTRTHRHTDTRTHGDTQRHTDTRTHTETHRDTEAERVCFGRFIIFLPLCSNRDPSVKCFQEVDGIQHRRAMPDDNWCADARLCGGVPGNDRRANASLMGRCVRRLPTAAMAMVLLLQAIPVAAAATGDMEAPCLSQQTLARSHVHDGWIQELRHRPKSSTQRRRSPKPDRQCQSKQL